MIRTSGHATRPTVTLTERVPAPTDARGAKLSAAGLVVSYVILAGTALIGPAPVFLGAVVLVVAAEGAISIRGRFVGWALRRVGVGGLWRGLLRGVTGVLFVARSDLDGGWLLLAGAGVLAFAATGFGGCGVAELLRRQRKMPLVSRGLDLAPVRIPAPAPSALSTRTDETLPLADLALLLGLAVAVVTESFLVAVAGLVVGLGGALVGLTILLRAVIAMRRLPRRRYCAAVHRALADVAPRLAVYFGGGPESLYQLQSWLATIERLEQPSLIILRDRECFRQLGPTRLPVLCVEHASALLALSLPDLRAVLYPAHSATNLDMLRRRDVRHVFIGHGDSDKSVSTNPFTKVYDEQWVAGPAAVERFRTADVGVDLDRLVEIGRPQVDPLAQMSGSPTGVVITVLYAPTWEGYGDEPSQTSLTSFGVDLVRWLVAEPDVRVLYRPHPLTGNQDPAARRAHREIIRLLGGDAAIPAAPADSDDPTARAGDDLALADVSTSMSRTERLAALEVWSRKRLSEDVEDYRHLVVPGPAFSLFACFEAADALVADVSSLVSDFVVTGKPYGVTSPADWPAETLAERFSSTRGGYVLIPDGNGLGELLAAARGDGDPLLSTRTALRHHLVGPVNPPAMQRMRTEVCRIVQESPDSSVVPEQPAERMSPPHSGAEGVAVSARKV